LFFQVFVENAVLHGLRKTTEAIPTLTLVLDETDDMFVFRICDNGPGISRQKKEAHTSLGIQLLRDRFALKREIYNWHMHFSVKENEIIENNIKTEIIITFGKVLLETTDNEYPDR
jgi:LytS/YehU family sensor histidine kinase